MKVKCNAKINLYFKIVGNDGEFHLIDSCFVPINLYDYINIRRASEDYVYGVNVKVADNLIYKAIKLLKSVYSVNECFEVQIIKNIPVLSGLGGGSSDAAFTLLALNEILNLKLSEDELSSLAFRLGCDVCFFIKNKPSHVSGRGEIIEPYEHFKPIKGLLIYDGLLFSTKDIYRDFDNNPTINKDYINDLENGVYNQTNGHRIFEIKNDLNKYNASVSSMTGSGGCVFGIFEKNKDLNQAYKELRKKYKKVYKFKSL